MRTLWKLLAAAILTIGGIGVGHITHASAAYSGCTSWGVNNRTTGSKCSVLTPPHTMRNRTSCYNYESGQNVIRYGNLVSSGGAISSVTCTAEEGWVSVTGWIYT